MRSIRVATDHDLPALSAAFQAAGMTVGYWPSTIFLAEENGQLLGGIALDWCTGIAKVGPLLLAPGHEHKKWVVLRLIEFVESFLAKAGVRHYTFYIPKNNLAFQRVAEHAGARPYAAIPGGTFYMREVGYGRQ